MKNTVEIDRKNKTIIINDQAEKQKFIIWFLTLITIFNGGVLSFNKAGGFIPVLGRILIVLGLLMLFFVLFKLSYQKTITFAEIKDFTIKESMGRSLPSLKLKSGKIRRIFKPVSKDNQIFLRKQFGKKKN